jgi:hypothetical protein
MNIVPFNSPMRNTACFDIILVNNWQTHATNRNQLLFNDQLVDIMFFHELCPPQFKKEDRYLLQNNLKNTYKVFLTEDIFASWQLYNDPKSFMVPYGIPEIDYKSDDKSQILLINMNNDTDINNLYHIIRNTYPDIQIINSGDYNSIVASFKKAKIIIDMTNTYNILLGIGCGAYTITNKLFDSKLKSTFFIKTVTDIITHIDNIMNRTQSFASQLELDKSYIKTKYNLDNFIGSFTNIIQQAKLEPFVL